MFKKYILIIKYIAVPKKNDVKPSANGPVERIIIELKLKTNPEIINRPDMI